MKQVLSYTAGGLLVGWIGYILISPDMSTRVNRTCMPSAVAVRLLGATVRLVDQETGESVAQNSALAALRTCRESVWYLVFDSKTPPKFEDSDFIFGNYGRKPEQANASTSTPTGTVPAPPGGATQAPTPQVTAHAAPTAAAHTKPTPATSAPKNPDDEDRL